MNPFLSHERQASYIPNSPMNLMIDATGFADSYGEFDFVKVIELVPRLVNEEEGPSQLVKDIQAKLWIDLERMSQKRNIGENFKAAHFLGALLGYHVAWSDESDNDLQQRENTLKDIDRALLAMNTTRDEKGNFCGTAFMNGLTMSLRESLINGGSVSKSLCLDVEKFVELRLVEIRNGKLVGQEDVPQARVQKFLQKLNTFMRSTSRPHPSTYGFTYPNSKQTENTDKNLEE